MKSKRRKYSGKFKAEVALEALRGRSSVNELSSKYAVHANQIDRWKKRLAEAAEELLSDKRVKQGEADLRLQSKLYEQIGRLEMELEWLKKSARE